MFQNLLTKEYKKNLRREYFLRVGTVCMLLFSVSFLLGLVSLIPTYVDLVGNIRHNKSLLSERSEDTESSKELNRIIIETGQIIEVLEQGYSREKVTEIIAETLSERPEGVMITGFVYDRKGRRLTVEGISKTRDLVAPYARNLESKSRFEEVPVPISDLAKNVDLEFRFSASLSKDEQYEE